MSESDPVGLPDVDQEYQAIEAALLETARGRWFLAEHSRRSRRLDNAQLEDAVDRLRSSLREPPAMLQRLRTDLDAVAQLLEDARSAILARTEHGAGPGQHANGLTGLVEAAEELHELIWASRAAPATPEICERIGRQATTMVALGVLQSESSAQAVRFAEAIDRVARRVTSALETIQVELGSDSAEVTAFEGYALPDPLPLDTFLRRPLALG